MKKILLLLFGMLCLGSAYAQGGWEKLLDNDELNSRAVDFWEAPNGDFLVLYNDGVIRTIWVDQDGQTISQNSIPTDGYYKRASDLLPLPDGNFLIIGTRAVSNTTSPFDVLAAKITPSGDLLWEKHYGAENTTYFTNKALLTPNDEPLITGFLSENFGAVKPYILKLDQAGDSLFLNLLPVTESATTIQDAHPLPDGNGLILIANSGKFILAKINADGLILDQVEFEENPDPGHNLNLEQMGITPDGSIGVFAIHNYNFLGELYERFMFYKFNSDLEYNWKVVLDSLDQSAGAAIYSGKVSHDEAGNFVVLIGASRSYELNDFPDYSRLYFQKIDQQGNLLSQTIQSYDDHRISPGAFSRTNDGSYFYCGYYKQGPPPDFSIPDFSFMAKLDSEGRSLTNQIRGQLFFDQNLDCTIQSSEPVLPGWFVTAFNDDFTYFDLIDENGQYRIDVGTGDYEIAAIGFADYWAFCSPTNSVNFTETHDTLTIDFAAQANIDCPAMWIDISTPLLRNCFDNYYHIQFCNWGTVPEAEVSIEITLPEGIDPISADLPYTLLANGRLLFEIGEMAVNECASFNLTVFVDCQEVEMGQTLCTEAHIFPDSLCLPTSNWSGASIEVTGECEEDNLINFLITNVGDAPTSQSLKYIVVEDQVIMSQGNFDLAPAQSLAIPVNATGSTYRLAAQQEPNHPGQSNPSFTIEGCGGLTPGLVNLFPMDDADPFIDIDCKAVVASYDPNDKAGFPLGREEEHFIDQNVDLEYLIRFQNTGTDTAFRVVIRDTLSPFLQAATVRPGASSHPYTFELTGNGVLKFTFDNILLPDSSSNLVASNGFVEFKVSQKPDNPIGTVINNAAAIYFDFNAPIITNTTIHTIGEALLTNIQSLQEDIQVDHLSVYPNPFSSTTTIEISQLDFDWGRLEVFDLNGRAVDQIDFDQTVFIFERKQLAPGIYPFVIYLDQQASLSGQLVILN
ncbi:MAG: hypothetical protein AAF985_04850 [Bacteroidota bacterium]